MRVLDLFSGIGGFSLGLERAGMQTVAFCEIEEYPRQVLKKHWPDVPIYKDVTKLTKAKLDEDGITDIDVICGGFPCQDVSLAGKGAGLAGERSGLWSEFASLIGEIRPRYAIVENVSALLHRGLSDVLGDLAALGYDTEWHCIPASYLGAQHIRDRIWIIAHSDEMREQQQKRCDQNIRGWIDDKTKKNATYPISNGLQGCSEDRRNPEIADPEPSRCETGGASIKGVASDSGRWRQSLKIFIAGIRRQKQVPGHKYWEITSKPFVCRGTDGLSAGVHRHRSKRLMALGNAVIPQIPEAIGKAIMELEHDQNRS